MRINPSSVHFTVMELLPALLMTLVRFGLMGTPRAEHQHYLAASIAASVSVSSMPD